MRGIRTRFWEYGQGRTILFVHGGGFDYRMGVTGEDWEELAGALGRDFHSIAVDKLGCGGTDNPRSPADYTMADVAEHVVQFMTQLSLEDVVLVGNSRGALPAAVAALKEPSRVRHLILINSNTLPPKRKTPTAPAVLSSYDPWAVPTTDMIYEMFGNVFDDAGSLYAKRYLERKVTNLLSWTSTGHRDRPMEPEAIARAVSLERQVLIPSIAPLREAVLEKIEREGFPQPTLLLWGARDVTAPYELGMDVFQLGRSASARLEFHLFNRGRHLVHVEYPDMVAGVIREFVCR